MATKKYLKRYWQLYILLILPIIYFIIFSYAPMYGVIIAFKKYNIFAGVLKSPWVVVAGMVFQVFATKGIINEILTSLGIDTVPFLSNKYWWVLVYVIVGIWHGAGYGTIVYMAALSGIDPQLYDAAYVDGANRWKRMWYVTLPGIKSTIVILLILTLGKIVNIGFDRPYLLQNSLVNDFSRVLSIYVYETGIQSGRFNYATAVGLFQSLVGLVMLVTVNRIANKMGEAGVV